MLTQAESVEDLAGGRFGGSGAGDDVSFQGVADLAHLGVLGYRESHLLLHQFPKPAEILLSSFCEQGAVGLLSLKVLLEGKLRCA